MPLSKPKKVGRPKLPKGEAKGKIVALRLNPEDVKKYTTAAKTKNLSVSEWIRSTLNASL
jgi:predicted HicB family RNase H-like nuclease